MLKDVIKKVPVNKETIISDTFPYSFKNDSFVTNYSRVGSYNLKFVMSKKSDEELFFGMKQDQLKRVGKTFFVQTSWADCIIIKNEKISISKTINLDSIKFFLTALNIVWWKDLDDVDINFFKRKTILKDILLSRIYNIETLYKTIEHKLYKSKDIGWRQFRSFMHIKYRSWNFSFFDLKEFTTNIINSINTIIANESNLETLSLLSDILTCAMKLDQKVDFTWSIKRLREEHNKQTKLLHLKDISKKEQKEIYSQRIDGESIKMLNTELEVYLEGLNMHHCLYNCYYTRIKQYKYMAFHMFLPEDCTFSVCYKDKSIIFDQIYLSYDRPVAESTKELAKQFIKNNENKIKCLFENSKVDSIDTSPLLLSF